MTHGNQILCQTCRILLFMAPVLVGFAFNSCKSSRNMVEETRTEFHYSWQDSTRVDSVLMGGNERSSESDTTRVSTGATGTVEIKRDSVGRPIFIYWTYAGNFSAFSKRDTEAQEGFFGLNASRYSESSGAVDSVNEKTEETTEEINTAISLENIIGPGLLGLILLYLIYAIWIRLRRR